MGYCLPTALLVVIHSPVLAFIVQMFRGASTLVVDVLAVTALQRAVPSDQLARVFGVFFAFVLGAIALGTLLTPIVVNSAGLNAGLWTMALAPAILALIGYPTLQAVDRETSARAAELEPRVVLLERLGIFAAASRPILERLATIAQEAAFSAGADILTEGDDADAVYVLSSGEVQVSARGEAGGRSRPIRTMAAPAYFGEIGVLQRIPRTASVRAIGEVTTLRIEGEALREALTASPASSSLMENARSRLALTHPVRAASFGSETEIEAEKPWVN
jgi:MFS family permease